MGKDPLLGVGGLPITALALRLNGTAQPMATGRLGKSWVVWRLGKSGSVTKCGGPDARYVFQKTAFEGWGTKSTPKVHVFSEPNIKTMVPGAGSGSAKVQCGWTWRVKTDGFQRLMTFGAGLGRREAQKHHGGAAGRLSRCTALPGGDEGADDHATEVTGAVDVWGSVRPILVYVSFLFTNTNLPALLA